MAVTAAASPNSLPQLVVDWTIAGHQGTGPLVAAHYDFQKIFGRGQDEVPHAQVIDDQRLPRRLGPHEDSFATDHTDSSKRYQTQD
jgi:hypothetical protein